MKRDQVERLLELYPKIFLACHTRHVRDPETGEQLSSHQASILDHLDETDPLTLAGLARHMGVTPGTMSVAIDRLVALGYVLRSRDEEDGRRVNLRLSPAGLRIKSSQSVLDRELVAALLARLTPEERERGLEGLALLARAAGEIQREKSERGAWHRGGQSGEQPDGE
jgi:DNA-binding MarR family transcriptional regulator